MLRFTLDHNCIIDLETGTQPVAGCLRELLALHDSGKVAVQLVATSASENQPGGAPLENFAQFQERLASFGLGQLDLLAPIAVVGLSYLDWCIVAGDQDIALLDRIEAVLFPRHGDVTLTTVEPNADPAAIEKRWRNEALDIHALWCHIHYGGDVFVTSDRNFFKTTKQRRLAELGAPQISRPCDALRAPEVIAQKRRLAR